MPDIFDQVSSEMPASSSAPAGDVFDQVHAVMSKPMAERQISGVSRVLSQADEATRSRLLGTGITPGTAMEFASQHVAHENAQRATRGEPSVDPDMQLAIEDVYKRTAGRDDLSNQDFYQKTRQERLAKRDETVGGRLVNYGLAAVDRLAAQPVLKAVGTVAPETASQLSAGEQAIFGTDPRSWSARIGGYAGDLSKLAITQAAGVIPMMSEFAGEGFGGSRLEAQQQREQGHPVETWDDIKTATERAAVQAVLGYAQNKLFGGSQPFPAKLLQDAGMAVGQTAVDNWLAQNIDPNRPITHGMLESLITSPLFTTVGHVVGGGTQRRGEESPSRGPITEAELTQMARDLGQVSGKTTLEVNGRVIEVPTEQATTAAAEPARPVEAPAKGETPPKVETPVQERHPAELANSEEVGKWYGKTYNDDKNASAIKALLDADGQGKYILADVPVNKVEALAMEGTGDVDKAKVDKIASMTPEERAKLPPTIMGAMGEDLVVADGTHRLLAGRKAGDQTIRAYVPERLVSSEGIKAVGEPAPVKVPPTQSGEPAQTRLGLPHPPAGSRDWTFKQYKWWAEKNGYDVSGVAYLRDMRKSVERQREQAEQGKTIISGDEREQLRKELEQEKRLRRTDELTGAPNKIQYDEDAARVFADADARNESTAVVETDIGNLKVMNTVYGHAGGDEMLKMAHEAMREELRMPPQKDRPADYLGSAAYRIGGDEFPAILRGVGSKAEVKAAFDRINANFDKKLAERFPDLPKEARPFIAWDASIRKPGDKTAIADLRKTADVGVEAVKAAEKARRGIPEGRTELLDYVKKSAAVTRQVTANKAPVTGTDHKRHMPSGVEELITPIDSRVRDISPHMYDRLMRMQFTADTRREQLKRELVEPAQKITAALGGKGSKPYVEFSLRVWNQDYAGAKSLLPAGLRGDFDKFAKTFSGLLADQKDAGVKVGELEDYWPRYVRDYRSLQKVIGAEQMGQFDEAYAAARAVKGKYTLTADEKTEIANSQFQGFGPRKPGTYGPAHARERSLEKMTSEMLEHYSDPFESAFRYIDAATYAAERSRFLGRNPDPAKLDESIGRIVQEEVDAGRLSPDAQDEAAHLFRTRFTADMLSMSRAGRVAKQVTYAFSLGQFRHAANQIADVFMTLHEHGLGATWKGLKAAIGPKDNRIMMEELGIHDHGEEFKDVNRVSKVTDRILAVTGFKAFDRLGKEVRINAANTAFERAAKTPDSIAYRRLERDYKPVLGDRFEATMADFREGRESENTRYLLSLDLTKVQPISLNQMPAQYLKMQNGRILYSMKSFMLKQIDYVRRETFRKMATPGQRVEGLKNLAGLIALVAGGTMAKDLLMDLIRGKQITVDQVPTRMVDSMLGLVGLNTYSVKKLWADPIEGVVNLVTPPGGFVTGLWKDTTGQGSGQSVKYAPVIGELFYYWFGHGATQNRDAAKAGYRKQLQKLWQEAATAKKSGDTATASSLLAIYNDRRKQGTSDGRNKPLTFRDLDFPPMTTGERQEQKATRESAVEAVKNNDTAGAQVALNKYNVRRRSRKTMAQLRQEAGGEN